MTYIFITFGLIAIYFIISAIKEGEARKTIELERKANNRKIANLHFDNLLKRNEMMEEARKNFSQQLEKQEGIHKVNIEENTLNITLKEENVSTHQANNDAQVWIDTLLPTTGVEVVKIYDRNGFICGSAKRKNEEECTETESHASSNKNTNPSPADDDEKKIRDEYHEIENTKFKISSMFYNFCFSSETSKIFLEESDIRQQISEGLMASFVEEKNIIEKILKLFLKKKYDFVLGESSYGAYRLNGYKFRLDKITFRLDEISNFFEVLYNDIEDVKDESGNELAVAQEFILYVKNFKPSAIFILVYDPFIEKYAVRRVLENGTSIKLTFIENNEGSDCIDFLKDYVSRNF
ncbi:MAG TPA: hypothetical protein PKN96_00765 [Flavobacterium sp.]|uniref:hypothetical protein n=1 Tax=Flavobacterium sp. TaxID=239 RepID=UPI002CA44E43|nr:hypothetical protein [Flavobacterium sp.]HNP31802.1 hypothetical protein [Flavobacterium sp.]